MQQKSINFTGTGNQTILDVATTARSQVFDYAIIVSGAGTAILKDEAGTEFGRYTFVNAGDGIIRPPLGNGGPRFTAVGDLILNMSTSLTVTGDFTWAANL